MGNIHSEYCECKGYTTTTQSVMNKDGDISCQRCRKINLCKCDKNTRYHYSQTDYLQNNKTRCGKCRGWIKSKYCECKPDMNINPFVMEYDIGMLSPEGDSLCKNCEKIKICKCDEETRANFSNQDFLTTNKKKCCGKCQNYLI